MEYPVPTRADMAPPIQECFCDKCGLIAPAWFHSDFILHGSGFTCVWCAFPEGHEVREKMKENGNHREKPVGPYRAA